MTFDDEFDTLSISDNGALNHTLWSDHYWWEKFPAKKTCDMPASGQYNPFSVKDGILSIVARRDPSSPCELRWATGVLVSVNSQGQGFSQTYGYFEIRAKIPKRQGLYSSFWLMNTSHIHGREPHSEIDILEVLGSKPNVLFTTIHTHDPAYRSQERMIENNIKGPNWQNRNNKHDVGDMSDGFHTYGLSWNKRRLTFYYDRKAVLNLPTPNDFNQPMYVIASLGLGGWLGPPGNKTPSPAAYKIDYVRVYSDAPDAKAVAENPERDTKFSP